MYLNSVFSHMNIIFTSTILSYFRFLFLSFLFVILAACATSNNDKTSVIDLEDIVISEEYGIDTQLNEKFNQAIELINKKKYEAAIELLEVVTDKTQKHSAPYVNLAIAYSRVGKLEKAENILLKAIKINPTHPVTNNELGLLYRKTGRFTDAKKTYENVIKVFPQFLPARKNLGILCDLFMNNLECAIEQYKAYLSINSNDKKMKIWLADLERRTGQ